MNRLKIFSLSAVLCLAANAFAQAPKAAAPAPQAVKTASPSIATVVDREVANIEKEFVDAAEAMPEDKFNFTPSALNIPNSEFKGVRTFAEEVRHVAATNYLLWGAITGDRSPIALERDNGPDLKTKAEIVKYLKDSFALGHKAAQSLTADNLVVMVPSPFGQGQMSKLFCATFGVAHGFDHYGQMVEYLRMNGIVPPASRGN